ncbi:hypothetical protein ACQKM9_15650 [Viridibacillus sp. NPDC093762]|uniref:hypothetical protein n=1 Tax=Viridibacillus sp. NPDC093762 TaxID=3390720 RepID=UPI003D048A53
MNSKTNQKINQVTEITLIVGIDLAKHKHYACSIDERGRVLHSVVELLLPRMTQAKRP